jgi:hypothetical protein
MDVTGFSDFFPRNRYGKALAAVKGTDVVSGTLLNRPKIQPMA